MSSIAPVPATLEVAGEIFRYVPVPRTPAIDRLPVALRILIENVLRCVDDPDRVERYVDRIVSAGTAGEAGDEIEFMPARVLFQDFTGVPVFCDFAALRDAAVARGGDPARVNPQIPCDLVIDHSVTADVTSCPEAAEENMRREAARNAERFAFLKWAAQSFDNVRIVPPGRGICHQLNIEQFCRIAWTRETAEGPLVYFDTLVGTDSHTTTANGVGVLGWGVGGIEAEAAALGQPITLTVPPVVGVRLTGAPQPGVTAMDIALTFAERLRAEGVVGTIAECFGPGVSALSATQRATIANMTPEYGCTSTIFPPDEIALAELEAFGRPRDAQIARAYLTAQGMLGGAGAETVYARTIEIDLSAVEPSLAGPSRPHDRVPLSGLKERFLSALDQHGRAPRERFSLGAGSIGHGAVALAAITSCTTATDPAMMIAAGLTARRARVLGCTVPSWVKCVFAPGSHATTDLMARAGVLDDLAALGFSVCGYGCMSCIGNSGDLAPEVHALAGSCELVSVLSGNRNFEGRISPDVTQNYLCAPALVVAYALAGTVDIDLTREPVCQAPQGPVMLSDLLPDAAEVSAALAAARTSDLYRDAAATLFAGGASWDAIPAPTGSVFAWDDASTYVRRPPFADVPAATETFELTDARALVALGDFVTTDHISPAGSIAPDSDAACYLIEHGQERAQFNSYGARRGNHEVMMRGTFGNIRLENRLADGRRGPVTIDPVTGAATSVFEASRSAARAGIPLIVLAGKMYGSGSSRDWAAKGPALLGVRAVIAESFERIHRSNLVGMGILPLELDPGVTAQALGLTGRESFSVPAFAYADCAQGRMRVVCTARRDDGFCVEFPVSIRIDTPTEAAYVARGGILPYVLDRLI